MQAEHVEQVGQLKKKQPRVGAASALPPRFLVLGAGTTLFSLTAWTISASSGATAALGTVVTALLFIAGVALLLWALLSHAEAPWPLTHRVRRRYRLASFALLCALTLGAVMSLSFAVTTLAANGNGASTTIYGSDAAAFNHYNAQLVLHGENPYTSDDSFWDAIHQFPSVGATPLRRGRYAASQYGPSLTQLVRDVRYEQAHPAARGPEYAPASLHSYPALAFLVYVPGVWAGLPTTTLTGLLFALAFLLVAGWGVPKGMRLPLWLLLLANQFLLVETVRGGFEVIALLPALLAWRTLDRRWLSPLLLGLGCAVKQIAWPLVPFYLIIIWRRNGPREALRRLALLLAAFLLPNAPFIITAPRAWATSMLLPVTLPIFPSGIGLIAFARASLLPLWPSSVYSALALAALLGSLLWFARARKLPPPAVALVIGILPFFLAWHSAPAYFVALPTLAVAGAVPLLRRDVSASAQTIAIIQDQ